MGKEILDIALVAGGVCGIVWSVIAGFRTSNFIKRAIETAGEVIDLQKSRGSGQFGNYDYAPIFRFATAEGKSYTITSKVGSSPPGFNVGERVRVRYDATDPENARIETAFQTWGETIIPMVIGIALIGFAILNESGAFSHSS
jgi:hypothetical protein